MTTISFNPSLTTNAAGGFTVQSEGYVQGSAMDDPAVRFALAGGLIAATETLPMYGGLAIYEDVAGPATYNGSVMPGTGTLGGLVGRATSLATITGFSVFNQASSWIQLPGSEVPVGSTGQTVPFYRLGSGARIPVAIDQSLVSLQGQLITSQVSWDFTLQRLVPYAPVEPAEPITTVAWSGGVVTVTTPTPHGYAVGDDVTLSGITPAGYNGDWTVASVPSSTTWTYALATNPGTQTVAGQANPGGGLLPVRILKLNLGNSKMVAVNPNTGALTWNPTGNAALILI